MKQTLYDMIAAVLLRHFQPAEIDSAAEELHALVIETYGPEF
ncbi:hypothetical protein PBI_EQUEMIOH13_69 [Mycobacterium phage Equemioh13]|uniref:Uncharacterized protein n=2 Tax=Turbidovirus TaxID=2948936 RepID=A0A076YKN4_9CAUD|nr:hypothetical protein AVV38_gp34 [Mycobacterium phage Piro94]YP_009203338.1 hypothetical protein AVT12_gp37 [Mycobacterium phage Equemioh13]YP_010063685.1 hypothetical protein KIY82_gp37 [Mycobacterium phage Centaur]AMB18559.1 hypothetical protein NASIATALIE_69 [Mycobacterium phage NaSiaTalie]AOZ64012.1 hypothetical protein SEA_BAEHEXIC_68 [Mycobacterium phage Baehexic]ATN92302.1 hypothetical protein SEA_UPDAWG_70 [Mycobacterium phage Updawg]AYD86344.1 hypothetical protein SEA_FLARE16_69 [M